MCLLSPRWDNKTFFFQCKLARSIWSVIQIASGLYPGFSVANVFGNWLHGIDHMFLTLKVLLLCRLSTDVPGLFVYGPLYNAWRIEACLWRCVHDWRLRRGILLPNMGGSMILWLAPLRFRRYTDTTCFPCISPFYIIFYLNERTLFGCVHLSYAEAGCNA